MIYDYVCKSCEKKFQLDYPMTATIKNARCPHCRSKKVKKIIHRAEIIFKAPGFYSSDNKK